MTDEDFNAEAQRLLDLGWSRIKLNSTNKYKLLMLYSVHTGGNPCCIEELEKFYKELLLLTNYNPNLSIMAKSNFQLKENQVIYLKSKNMHVTNANITDDLAMEIMIQYGPKADAMFSQSPSDKADLLKAYIASKAKKPADNKAAVPKTPAKPASKPTAATAKKPADNKAAADEKTAESGDKK